MTIHNGGCHCGNLSLSYRTGVDPARTEVRACQCTFCRKHGALAVSDPAGEVLFSIKDPSRLLRYQFALNTAEYLVCGCCGVYVGAVMVDTSPIYGIAIVNTFDDPTPFTRAPVAVDYDHEDELRRRQRRQERWMPARIEIAPA